MVPQERETKSWFFSMPDGIDWHDAVRIGLQYEFHLAPAVIDKVCVVEGYWCKEQGGSGQVSSVPGLPTTYLTHEIRLRVTDKDNQELQKNWPSRDVLLYNWLPGWSIQKLDMVAIWHGSFACRHFAGLVSAPWYQLARV